MEESERGCREASETFTQEALARSEREEVGLGAPGSWAPPWEGGERSDQGPMSLVE